MSETGNADDEETLPEDEYDFEVTDLTSLRNYLINMIVSVARQFFCSCSVIIFPALTALHESTFVVITQEIKIIDPETKKIDRVASHKANDLVFRRDMLMGDISGIIMAGILLYWIGRKYTVITANLSYLVALIYAYTTGLGLWVPYEYVVATHGIKYFGIITYFIYVAEICTPTFRAFLMGIYFYNEAVFSSLIIDVIKEERMLITIRNCTVITSLSLLLAIFIPETPFWLILKGNPEKAEEFFTWLRAGNPNPLEFDQMMARAENIIENKGTIPDLLSRTFVLGLIFSLCIVISGFDHCRVMETMLNEFYFPSDMMLQAKQWLELKLLINAGNDLKWLHRIYGSFIFLLFILVVPRKILYILSHGFGILIIGMVTLHLGSMNTLIKMASFCNLSPYVGIVQLSLILPVEIYPAALREVGVAVTTIASRANMYYFFPLYFENPAMSYLAFYGSFIGVLFILIFMPETSRKNLYELDELNLNLPFIYKKSSEGEGEGSFSEDEGEVDEDAS